MLAGPSHSSRIQAALGVPGEFIPNPWFHCGNDMEAMLPGAGAPHGGAHDGRALRSSFRKAFAAGLPD